jgi:hypothetical protein
VIIYLFTRWSHRFDPAIYFVGDSSQHWHINRFEVCQTTSEFTDDFFFVEEPYILFLKYSFYLL